MILTLFKAKCIKIATLFHERDRFMVQCMLIYQNAVFLLEHAVSSMQAK